MNEETFKRLPGSTNAVESYNRCSKTEKPDIRKMAMMYTYKVDMAAALENLAIAQKITMSYNNMMPDDRKNGGCLHELDKWSKLVWRVRQLERQTVY